MKVLAVFLGILFTSFAFGQDVIVKTDGSEIKCKVLKINEQKIIYKHKNIESEPLRSIAVRSVEKIVYENGTEESFANTFTRYRLKQKMRKLPILKSGFYLDGLIGAVGITTLRSYYNVPIGGGNQGYKKEDIINTDVYFSHGMRVGNKWYFGKHEKMRFGINATWLRFAVLFEDMYPSSFSFAPMNIGFTGAFKFNGKHGLEINTFTGMIATVGDIDDRQLFVGLNPKYRCGNLSIGLDYGYSFKIDNFGHSNHFNVSIGVKF